MNKRNNKLRVCFLPVAGKDCPHQQLTMKGVAESGRFEVRHGVHARFFPCMRTMLRDWPDLLYFDWIDRYYLGRNRVVSWLKMCALYLDVLLTTKVFCRPIYWTVHNLHSHENRNFRPAELHMQRFFARNAARIRVFSQSAVVRAGVHLQVDSAKLFVIPEGNYINYYPNEISRFDARKNLKLPEPAFVLLWLGHIRPYKGLTELVKAFRKVARVHWRLIIAGRPYIESYAREVAGLVDGDQRIDFYPQFIAQEKLQTFYNAADAVVLPFTDIENSASLTMSMGFRKPVVAPNLGVIGERLHRQPELVYAPGPNGLEEALEILAQLPPTRLAEIGAANFAEVSRHQWSDLEALFDQAMKH